jgi:predicted amidohydrolase
MSPSVRIAAIQARPESDLFDDMWNGGDVAHAVDLLETAARAGAACICFPELYPRVGEAEICAAARRLGVFVVAGLIEGTRASWHNTATVIGPDGRVLGRQSKCFPTQNEIDNGVMAGKGYRVIETDIGRLGIVICADFAFFSEGVTLSSIREWTSSSTHRGGSPSARPIPAPSSAATCSTARR